MISNEKVTFKFNSRVIKEQLKLFILLLYRLREKIIPSLKRFIKGGIL